jgi:D-arabinose 1-dehydrogenase
MVLTFCHLTLQNSSLIEFLPLFEEWGQVSQVVAASPLSMGLLTSNPPVWHPAPSPLQQLSNEADQLCKSERTSLAATALHYALHHHHNQNHSMNPVVIGLSTLKEVHEVMHAFRTGDVVEGGNHLELESKIKAMYQTAGFQDWSWASPPHE